MAAAKLPSAVASAAALPTFSLGPSFTPPQTFTRLLAPAPAPDFRSAAVLTTVPWSDPAPGEVVVRIAYAGVNGGCETFRVRAEAGTPFERNWAAGGGAPVLLGAEGVGLVAAVGASVSSLAVGDAVSVAGANAFSQYVTAPAGRCTKLGPLGPTPAAIALALSGVTAAVALETCGVDKQGGGARPALSAADTVLITAAAGGTGHLAAQLAAASGAAVWATTGGEGKAAALRALLAPWPRARVVDYRAEDLAIVLAAECPPPGLSVAYEGVGGALRATAVGALAPGGRVLAVGHISEYPNAAPGRLPEGNSGVRDMPALPPAHDTFWGGATVDLGQGRKLYGNVWGGADVRAVAAARRGVFAAAAGGRLTVLVDGSGPDVDTPYVGLGAAADAVERLMGGESVGKVVLRVWEN